MFTGATIRLSMICEALGLTLLRDAEIAHVGKVPTRLDRRIVPVGTEAHLGEAAAETGIVAYVAPADLVAALPEESGAIVADRPMAVAMAIHEHLAELPGFLWSDFDTVIDPTARIMPGAYIAPQNVRIGPMTVVGPNAVVLERTIIGAACSIGAGSVLGMEAFEQRSGARPRRLLVQAGGVMLEDHVTLLPGCTIARSSFGGFTRIGQETQIDAQSYIAHDCRVGARVTICAGCAVSGRVEIGDDAYLGPNCTVSNGVRIGAQATVSLGGVVTRPVPDGARVSGNFALPHDNWLRLVRDYR
jgi:UDP-3-O-[3-hydroxymyristoyl] glucosamine N-acyltransferase